jgi:hypothetical protein
MTSKTGAYRIAERAARKGRPSYVELPMKPSVLAHARRFALSALFALARTRNNGNTDPGNPPANVCFWPISDIA